MSGERAGLKDGYPAYYPEEGGRIGAGGYRLRREDLEGSTVIIPELREVKAGDLLVRYEENGEVDLGIVVGVGWKEGEAQGLDNRELMEQVWVVTAKREFGMVSLGLWGNPNGRFGGFTDRPERYHVRRVLVKKEGEGSEGKRDGWELASYDLSGLKVDVSYEGERWIPNTKKRVEGKEEEEMEGIIVRRIEVKGSFEGGGSAQVLPQKRREVELLGVEDMYYEAGKGAETYGNIYNNQGSGIGLYSEEEGGEEHLIAKFERKEDGSYEVDYEGSYYGDEEGLGEEWAFLSDDEGRVWLEGRRGDGAGRIGRFVIKAIGDKICPGDDFLLSFGLSGEGEVRGRAEEGDFCGVYDKKLLWRANLYIGERGEDWNDTHPWNSEENEWNKSPKSLNGSDPDPSRMYTSAASDWVDGEGGQVIKIATYTPVRNYPGSNKVIGRVAYDYPANSDESYNNRVGVNSPFEFNRRMLDQQSKMETGEAIATIWPPDGYTMEGMAEWGSTAAPGTSGPLWNNYRKNPVANEYPGLPGIGLYFEDPAHATINDPKPTFPEIVDKDLIEHIGVDCVGFAKRAAGYSRDPYTWTNYPEVSWSGGSVHDPELIRSEGYPHEAKKSYVIISREGIKMSTTDTAYFTSEVDSEDGPSEEEFKKIQKEFLSIRSGDIIHYGTSHIGIIETIDVEALSNARTIVQLMTAVTTIESVYGSSVNFVIKRNMMEGLSGVTAVFNKAGSWHYDWDKDLRSWSIERLKVN